MTTAEMAHTVSGGCGNKERTWLQILAQAGPLTWRNYTLDCLVVASTFLVSYTAAHLLFERVLFPKLQRRRHGGGPGGAVADASSSSSAPPPVTRILSLCSSIYQQLHHHNRYHYRNHHYQQQQQQQQGKLWSSALRVARWLWGVSSPLLRVGRFHGLAFSCTFACAWMALQLVIFEILDGPYRRSNPPDFRRVRAM